MPLLNWLNRDADVKLGSRVLYRLLEESPSLSYGDTDTEVHNYRCDVALEGAELDSIGLRG